MNEEVLVGMRKCRKNIAVSGLAFIIIEIWTLIRSMVLISQNSGINSLLMIDDEDPINAVIFAYVILIAFLGITTLIHLYIGIAAMRYANGRSKKMWFVVIAMFYAFMSVKELPVTITGYIDQIQAAKPYSATDTTIASILVEITILFILFDMIISALRLLIAERKSVLR